MMQQVLARLAPRSLGLRLLAVAFLGIHTPLILLAGWLLLYGGLARREAITVLLVVLAATLLGTAATLLVMRRMLAPLRQAMAMLDASQSAPGLPPPRLPDTGQDEVSQLLRRINRSLQGADADLRDLEREAQTDALTGALNRRGCEQALANSVRRADGGSMPFVLFVVDLDNLKQLNDREGHAAGDAALVRLVEQARAWLGPRDWIGRWGGDEFLMGLHLEAVEACARVEDWRVHLEMPEGQAVRPLHLSAGAAVHLPGEERALLYRRADAAMYRAKFGGGRRLVLDTGAGAAPT